MRKSTSVVEANPPTGGDPSPPRILHRTLRWLRGLDRPAAWALVAVELGVSFGLVRLLGGAGRVAPHWFYLPIITAAARFGSYGVVATAALAGLLAGPLSPALVASGTPQSVTDWGSRMLAFVVVGLLIARLVEDTTRSVAAELDELRQAHELLEGIEQGQLILHYQPVFSFATGGVVGVEALVRWEHPRRGLLAAGEFVPLAERSSLIAILGTWVLGEGCRQLAEWRRSELRGVGEFFVAVNVSGVQLGRADLADEIVRVLGESGLDPSWLCLEVTETALVEDLEGSIEGLLGLRMLGVHVAVDDFGTGYSSLAYLRRLPVDIVKIAREFVQGMPDDPADAAIVAAVVSLVHSLGRTALAEGVESAHQAEAVRATGCDQVQGYYFGRPQPAAATGALLAASGERLSARP